MYMQFQEISPVNEKVHKRHAALTTYLYQYLFNHSCEEIFNRHEKHKKVQVGNDQEMAQSEKKSRYSKRGVGKN